MSESKRLHPIASVLNTGKRIKNLIIPMIVINASGGRDGRISLLIALIISAIVLLFTFITGILSWLRFTYRFEQDELRIEYGIFLRKKRYIPYERIQSINVTEGILQRLFGLVKVKIETAGGGDEAEAVLSAISKEEAVRIQTYVHDAKHSHPLNDGFEVESQTIFKISTQQLIVLSLTSGGMGVVFSAVLALFSQIDDFISYKKIFGRFELLLLHNVAMVLLLVFIGFLFVWIIGLIITMVKYTNFTVQKIDHELVISQGLLEKRQITIPLKRIQAIHISENMVRQLFGYGTVYVESAGGSSADQEGAKVTLLPIVKINQICPLLENYLPDYSFTTNFHPAPKRALWRYILRSWYMVIPIVIIALIFLKLWGLLSLVLVAAVTIRAVLKYQAAGWSLDQQQLSLRYRTNKRTTVYMKKNKIQSLEARVSYFQKKQELGTLEAFVKSGFGSAGGKVADLEQADIQRIYQWYSHGNGKGSFPKDKQKFGILPAIVDSKIQE